MTLRVEMQPAIPEKSGLDTRDVGETHNETTILLERPMDKRQESLRLGEVFKDVKQSDEVERSVGKISNFKHANLESDPWSPCCPPCTAAFELDAMQGETAALSKSG